MTDNAQRRAVENYRSKQARRGLVRFEVQARASDRELIRALARKLADQGEEATALRGAVHRALSGEAKPVGGVLAALRQSPLVGIDLDLERQREEGRRIDL